jgi:uncharacterized protein YjbJ (UPF0337 family)
MVSSMSNVVHPFADRSQAAAIRRRWPQLTGDDVAAVAGNRERLVVRIVERYGIAAEWADRQVADWEAEQANRAHTGS